MVRKASGGLVQQGICKIAGLMYKLKSLLLLKLLSNKDWYSKTPQLHKYPAR
jgi:hypothetical protein